MIAFTFILKIIAGFLSFEYHDYYFAGGDGAIYLKGGHDLIQFSQGNPITYLKLFFNLNRGIPEWEMLYDQIIYWDSKTAFNFINDNRNAIRINSVISLFSYNNTVAHIILLNFLTMIGLGALYKSFKMMFPQISSLAVYLAVFLSPSILFWTSGILKETHTVLFMGLYFWGLMRFIEKRSPARFFVVIFLFYLLLLSRSYLAIIIILMSLLLLIALKVKLQPRRKILGYTLIPMAGLWLLIFLLPNDVFSVIQLKQEDFIFIGQNANSFFKLPLLNQALDLFLYFPIAISNVFFQFQLLRFDSFLYIFPIIENIDVLFFCFIAIRFYKRPSNQILIFAFYCLLIYLLSSWLIGITVPIQGAIARYKALTQPLLLIFIFSLIDWERISQHYFTFNTKAS
jgi:hypothetical protein